MGLISSIESFSFTAAMLAIAKQSYLSMSDRGRKI